LGSEVQHWQTRRTTASPGPSNANYAAREMTVSVSDGQPYGHTQTSLGSTSARNRR
jgi:hypothetical protein